MHTVAASLGIKSSLNSINYLHDNMNYLQRLPLPSIRNLPDSRSGIINNTAFAAKQDKSEVEIHITFYIQPTDVNMLDTVRQRYPTKQ